MYLDALSMYIELTALINIIIYALPRYLSALELYLTSKNIEAEKIVNGIQKEMRKISRPEFIPRTSQNG